MSWSASKGAERKVLGRKTHVVDGTHEEGKVHAHSVLYGTRGHYVTGQIKPTRSRAGYCSLHASDQAEYFTFIASFQSHAAVQ